jgi:asparaginyl-tRNA synthetase
MNCAESYVQYLCKWLLKHCREDMEFMVKHVDPTAIERLELVSSTPFERISYTEAVKILQGTGKKFENKVEWGIDLASEHERFGDYNLYCYFCINYSTLFRCIVILSFNMKVFD